MEGKKFFVTIKNVGYALFANGVSLIVSIIATLIVPKAMSPVDYGYWQIYILYITYLGFFHFGLQDGIYLRYGGTQWQELDFPLLHSQVVFLTIMELAVGGLILGISTFLVADANKQFVWLIFAVSCVVYLVENLLNFMLQMTNRIQEYTRITLTDRIVYGILLIIILVFAANGHGDFRLILLADIIGHGIGLVQGCWQCREIIFCSSISLQDTLGEAKKNFSVGLKLLTANLAGLFVVGVVRFFIEAHWDVVTFGKASLALSLCNFILTFLTAVGTVLFPALRRVSKRELSDFYRVFDTGILLLVFALLGIYQPMCFIIKLWIPAYSISLRYLALLFPLCVFESKAAMLTTTYLKVLRQERALMFINILAVLVSAVTGWIAVFLLNSLEMAMLAILCGSACRCILSECCLHKVLSVPIASNLLWEVFLAISFVALNWRFLGLRALLPYGGLYLFFLLSNRQYFAGLKRSLMR